MNSSKIKFILEKVFRPERLVWLFPCLLIVPNIVLFITEQTSVISKITNVALPLGIYLLLMSSSRKVGRTTLYCFILALFAAFQLVLLYLYGESIIAIDMYVNLVTTNPGEAAELLGNLAFAIFIIIMLYFPPLLWAIALVYNKKYAEPSQLRKPRKYGLIITAAGLIALTLCYITVPGYRIKRELFPINVFHNMYTATKRTIEAHHYSETSSQFDYKASTTRDKNLREIYVLIIGETSRADNWQLNGYFRTTNPRLVQRGESLAVFPKALSESNITHKSVPLMLTWLSSDNFSDSIAYTKGILSAFNEAGYNTAYFSNQRRNHSYIDFFAAEAQKSEFIRDHQRGRRPPYDTDLVAYLEDFIANSPSNKIFIILHSYGSHFNYKERYPKEYAKFKPDNSSQASPEHKPELINAYDNTIVLTDALVDDVISVIEKEQCISSVIFASDHGEDIFDDDRERFLHASPTPTYYQLHVPVVIWMSEGMKASYPTFFSAAKSNSAKDVSSSSSLFHTLIHIAGMNTEYFKPELSLVNERYKFPGRKYLNDYNESVELSGSGLREIDFVRLDSAGISRQPFQDAR